MCLYTEVMKIAIFAQLDESKFGFLLAMREIFLVRLIIMFFQVHP